MNEFVWLGFFGAALGAVPFAVWGWRWRGRAKRAVSEAHEIYSEVGRTLALSSSERELRERLRTHRFRVWSDRDGLLYNRTLGQMLCGNYAVNDPLVYIPDRRSARHPGEFMRFDTEHGSFRLCLVDAPMDRTGFLTSPRG